MSGAPTVDGGKIATAAPPAPIAPAIAPNVAPSGSRSERRGSRRIEAGAAGLAFPPAKRRRTSRRRLPAPTPRDRRRSSPGLRVRGPPWSTQAGDLELGLLPADGPDRRGRPAPMIIGVQRRAPSRAPGGSPGRGRSPGGWTARTKGSALGSPRRSRRTVFARNPMNPSAHGSSAPMAKDRGADGEGRPERVARRCDRPLRTLVRYGIPAEGMSYTRPV